jgi:transposase
MFFRLKRSGPRSYLQIVENRREKGVVRQSVLVTLGRYEDLKAAGGLDALLQSGSRLSDSVLLLSAHRRGEVPALSCRRVGPPLVFERLWEKSGCREVLEQVGSARGFGFSVERVVFAAVLHRLMQSGSDRSAMRWQESYGISGQEDFALHHFYRAMALLGEPLAADEQEGATPFSARCTKDVVEERLFARNRDLFSSLSLVFFDTTSIYFYGQGGETLGRRGHSKDHRPDLKQMVVGVVVDGRGRPICCELWPGNTSDVKTLLPVVRRLKKRFGIERVSVVADRGMISEDTLEALKEQKVGFILGARMRSQSEVKDEVLSRGGRYQQVEPERTEATDPSPLKVKEVFVGDRRYVICKNEEQARKDAFDREQLVEGLREKLGQGPRALVGNKGYRRYVKGKKGAFEIDDEKLKDEARYDGKWVLRTDLDLPAAEIALQYKQLWVVEAMFRAMKSILGTRPVFHQSDEAIRGHVFCSFLALVLRTELHDRLTARGESFEWDEMLRDLDALEEVDVAQGAQRFVLRSEVRGCAGKVLQAVGVALPPACRQVSATAAIGQEAADTSDG